MTLASLNPSFAEIRDEMRSAEAGVGVQNPTQERLRLEIARMQKRIAGAEKAVSSREAAGEAAQGQITKLEADMAAVQQGDRSLSGLWSVSAAA